MTRLAPLFLIALLACDPPDRGPVRGVLRCTSLIVQPDMAKKLNVTEKFPSRSFLLEYRGSAQWLEVHVVQWHQGAECTSQHPQERIEESLTKELAIAICDVADDQGVPHSEIRLVDGKRSPDAGNKLQAGGSTSRDVTRTETAIRGRPWRVLDLRGPVEAPAGKELVLCSVLIGGNPKEDALVPPEQRVQQVDDGWILSVRLKK